MENLGDILKRLGTTRNITNGESVAQPVETDERGGVCAICGGKGWFTPNVPVGHPEFGQVVTCQCQQEKVREEQSERLLRYSNLGYLSRFTFDALVREGTSDDPDNRRLFGEAYQAAVEYAEGSEGWLMLAGPNGSGKTHLAAAIANRCIERGQVVFFVHVSDLLDHLRATYAPTSELSYSDMFDQVRNTPLLILDGLGSQSATPWAQEKLQQIVNHRYNAQLPTVFTTAVSLEELDPSLSARVQTRGLCRILQVQRRESPQVSRLGRIESEMLRRMTFDSFDVRGDRLKDMQRASLEYAYKFAKNYAVEPDGWLTLISTVTGVGKTHLAVAIAGERLKKSLPVFFTFAPELMDYLRYT